MRDKERERERLRERDYYKCDHRFSMLPPVQGQQLVPTRSYKLNDTQNIQVKSPGDIFTYIGLCDASAVYTLGLLHRGECIAVRKTIE